MMHGLRVVKVCVALIVAWALSAAVLIAPAWADNSSAVLTVTIPQDRDAPPRIVQLTRADLALFPVVKIETSTNWTNGIQAFTGVRLFDLLAALEISDGQLELQAINDYNISIPVSEVQPDGAILAYERNGAAMTTRDKGPLWLVYDYDASPKFRTETVYSRSIWQLDRITVSR